MQKAAIRFDHPVIVALFAVPGGDIGTIRFGQGSPSFGRDRGGASMLHLMGLENEGELN